MSNAHDGHFPARTVTRWRLALWAFAALLLAAPWLAMHVTDDVRWDAADFLLFGAMLAVAGAVMEIIVRVSTRRRVVVGTLLAVGALFLLLWAELAVGLFH